MSDTLAILEKVNGFYSASFDQLLIIVFGAIGLVGVLIPTLITYYQNRQFNIGKKTLENYIDSAKSELFSSIKEQMLIELNNEKELLNDALKANKEEINKAIKEVNSNVDVAIKKHKKELNKQIAISKGGLFLIQANNMADKEMFDRAVESSIFATEELIKGRDEHNLQRALSNLIDLHLPKVNKTILDLIPDIQDRVESLCKGMSSINENGRYGDNMSSLKLALKNALEREARSDNNGD